MYQQGRLVVQVEIVEDLVVVSAIHRSHHAHECVTVHEALTLRVESRFRCPSLAPHDKPPLKGVSLQSIVLPLRVHLGTFGSTTHILKGLRLFAGITLVLATSIQCHDLRDRSCKSCLDKGPGRIQNPSRSVFSALWPWVTAL